MEGMLKQFGFLILILTSNVTFDLIFMRLIYNPNCYKKNINIFIIFLYQHLCKPNLTKDLRSGIF